MSSTGFPETPKRALVSAVKQYPFYAQIPFIDEKESIIFKLGAVSQRLRTANDREMGGIRLFRVLWELPLFCGSDLDRECSSFLNRVNHFSPTSPLIYEPKSRLYKLATRIRVNPDNMPLMTQLFPQLGALQALTAKKIFEQKQEPLSLQRVGGFEPASLKALSELEIELKKAGASPSSRWEGVELFSAAAGVEATFKEPPRADLASLHLSFPFMDSKSSFVLDAKRVDPWLGKGVHAETFFKTNGNEAANLQMAATLNAVSFNKDVDHNCLGSLLAEQNGLRHRVFIPNAFFEGDLAQYLCANAYLLSTEADE
jgi:hypothetical protein